MKTISLIAAMEILKNCAAVIIDDNGLCYPSVYEDSEDFLFLQYENEGLVWEHVFSQTDNREEVKIHASTMFLIDVNGDEILITILDNKNIEDSEQ